MNASLCRDENLTHMFTLARQVQIPESQDMSSFRLKIVVNFFHLMSMKHGCKLWDLRLPKLNVFWLKHLFEY